MTGFARVAGPAKRRGGSATLLGGGWNVEIRSLNHRYFEFSLKVPPALYSLEDRIREFCQRAVKRGKVTVNISESAGSNLEDVALDEEVLRFYLSAIRKIQKRFRLEGNLSVSDLLSLPRIFSVEKKWEAPEKFWPTLKPLLEQAVEALQQSRAKEGKVLSKDILERIAKIEKGLSRIETCAKNLPKEYYEKLRGRIQELFETKLAQNDRVWQEAVLLAERADVTEEIVRFKSHLRLFREKMEKEDQVGKELDFILQEINREVNTLGSKSQNTDISKEVVLIKAELEKIREQIQNIE